METKLVKIIGCSGRGFWYSNDIGKTFEVYQAITSMGYTVKSESRHGVTEYIKVEDCIDVKRDAKEITEEIEAIKADLTRLQKELEDATELTIDDIKAFNVFEVRSTLIVLLPSSDFCSQSREDLFTKSGLSGNIACSYSDAPSSKSELFKQFKSAGVKKPTRCLKLSEI